jgi:hypothetical protein
MMTGTDACIEDLGQGVYRCTQKHFVIRTDVLPIHCDCELGAIAFYGDRSVFKPLQFPPIRRRLLGFWHALRPFVADYCRVVPLPEYRRRRAICDACAASRRGWCVICGCLLWLKARGRVFDCPRAKWSGRRGCTGCLG